MPDLEVGAIAKRSEKIGTALSRLEELYLFGEDGISQKDYILRSVIFRSNWKKSKLRLIHYNKKMAKQ